MRPTSTESAKAEFPYGQNPKMSMGWKRILALFLCFCAIAAMGQNAALYRNDFEKAEIGSVPEGLMILDGGFLTKAADGNKYLELPGAPLDRFTVLFGPAEGSNVTVTARIFAEAKGRRFPTFGVGLNGVAGYRLQLTPAKKVLELYLDDQLKATTAYEWKSGEWTHFRLQVSSSKPGEWEVAGKAWTGAAPEPAKWSITSTVSEEPPLGQAALFGSPFSGTPIRFDDLAVTRSGR